MISGRLKVKDNISGHIRTTGIMKNATWIEPQNNVGLEKIQSTIWNVSLSGSKSQQSSVTLGLIIILSVVAVDKPWNWHIGTEVKSWTIKGQLWCGKKKTFEKMTKQDNRWREATRSSCHHCSDKGLIIQTNLTFA